jgi:putative hydrolase
MTGDPFGDIPLFRELQRLLSAGGGPINLEIARQVATALATEGRPDPAPDPSRVRSLTNAAAEAEALAAGYTRLTPAEPVRIAVMGRSAWVGSTLGAWRWLLEALAERLSLAGGKRDGEQDPMAAALEQVVPLLMGIQAGTLLGHLARETLGRYDLPIPRDDDGRLVFVAPNIDAVARDYGFDLGAFHRWLALNDATKRLIEVAVPWSARYHRNLLIEVIDSIEIDAADLERRFADLQARGLEALQEGLSPEDLVPVVPTPRHIAALERLRAFLALVDGYSRHTAAEIAPRMIGDTARIDEGMARRALTPTQGEALLDALLGVSLDRTLESAGRTFCAAVIKLRSLGELNRVWEAPDNLPSLGEIKDPFAWMDRVLGS